MSKVLINIDVPELDAAVAFYTKAFELTPNRWFGSSGVELLGAEAPIYLLVKETGTTPHPQARITRNYARHWTPIHLDFAVGDLDAAFARVLAAGAHQESEIKNNRWGRIAMFSDPWGNEFCLIQFTAEGYDAVTTAGERS